MNKPITVFVTAPGELEAKKISAAVLKKKLVACASIIKDVDSSYWWKGKIEHSKESLIIMKTDKKLFNKLAAEVRRVHSYLVPEIIAFPITSGNPAYLKWINESVIKSKIKY